MISAASALTRRRVRTAETRSAKHEPEGREERKVRLAKRAITRTDLAKNDYGIIKAKYIAVPEN